MAAADTDVGGLEFVRPATLEFQQAVGKRQTKAVSIWVRNTVSSSVTPKFSTLLQDDAGRSARGVSVVPEVGSTFAAVPADSVIRLRIVVRGIDGKKALSGVLTATAARAAGTAPAAIPAKVAPTRDYDHTMEWILGVTAAFSFLLIGILWLHVGLGPTETLPAANFSYSGGYSQILTATGAVLGTIVVAGVLPEDTKNLAKDAYASLNAIFIVLIAVATLVYSTIQKQVNRPSGPELHGYVGLFMTGSALIAWAAFGELVTLGFLVGDIHDNKGFGDVEVAVLYGVLALAAVCMLVYIWTRIWQIVKAPAPAQVAARTPSEALPAPVAPARMPRLFL